MSGQYLIVLVTTGSVDEAKSIADLVVEARLAACATIVERVQSIFRWEGRKTSEMESLLILKTTSERFSQLQGRIQAAHSYSVPEIIALPIVNGLSDYLAWLDEQTRAENFSGRVDQQQSDQ